jgi:hypothetical protein
MLFGTPRGTAYGVVMNEVDTSKLVRVLRTTTTLSDPVVAPDV